MACQGTQRESTAKEESRVCTVLALHTMIILAAMRCTYLSSTWSSAYSPGEGAWMGAQWERTDPFQIRQAADDMTRKLSNLAAAALTARGQESFGSPLGWLSSQLQPFSAHVNRKLWVDLEAVFGSAEPAFWRGVALGSHVKDSLVICWDMNCFEGETFFLLFCHQGSIRQT